VLNRPRVDNGGAPEFLTLDRIGYPLFQRRSRMSDALRFFPDIESCAKLETTSHSGEMLPFAGRIRGTWETEHQQAAAIEDELVRGRDLLQQRLGNQVRHVCLPWGVSGKVTRAALERTGFVTAFANRMGGRFAVARGDDPFFLKRLSERYVFSLPGQGRRRLSFLR
jgi:hypothetical protein